jgi:FG-GAP-like repeat
MLHLSSYRSSILSSVALAIFLADATPFLSAQSAFLFGAPQEYTVTTTPNLLGTPVVSDFNGDGKPDLGIGFVNTQDGNSPLQFGMLLNKGTGFAAVTTTQLQANVGFQTTAWGAAADFNGDGRMDLVEATGGNLIATPGISVSLGNGDGTFQPAVLYGGADTIGPIAVGDFNNDGKTDVFCLVRNSVAYSLAVLLGKGDGTFNLVLSPITVGPGSFVVAGDYNGDGKLDVIFVEANSALLYFGNGDGTFTAGPAYSLISGSIGTINGIAAGDVNGDGIADIVVGTVVTNFPGTTSLVVMLGNGDGTFQTPLTTSAETSASPAALGDFNLDGKMDLVSLLSGNTVSFSMGNGDGTFQAPVHYSIGNPANGAAIADFDGNGGLDLAVVGATSLSVLYNGFGIGFGAGSNSTTATVSAGQTASYTLSIGGARLGGSASFVCTGAPQGATCTVPSSVAVNATTASNVSVSVSTTSRSKAAMGQRNIPFEGYWAAILIGMVLVPTTWKKCNSAGLYLSVIVGSLLPISSCGGSNSSSSNGGNPNGTPAGTYNVTVTSMLNPATQSVTLKLIVQ